jgi:hypothetical protein
VPGLTRRCQSACFVVRYVRALRMNGRAWRFVGNRRSSYILMTLPTATFGTELRAPGAGRIERGRYARGRIDQRWILAELGGRTRQRARTSEVSGEIPRWQVRLGSNQSRAARTRILRCIDLAGCIGICSAPIQSIAPTHAECRFGTDLVLVPGAPTLPTSGERRP